MVRGPAAAAVAAIQDQSAFPTASVRDPRLAMATLLRLGLMANHSSSSSRCKGSSSCAHKIDNSSVQDPDQGVVWLVQA